MEYKYKFSVVIPIYNVEQYLEETIESIINQTIGFKDNIQLILINDGSPDNSGEICKKYKKLYPNNVVYIEQENSGVSAARNNGIKHIEGELTTFLDSDDKWSLNAFKDAYEQYSKNPEIGVFSCKMVFFDGRKGNHQLNYKYAKNQVVDIFKQYRYPQLSSSSVFIRSDRLKDKQYCTDIKYSEDNRLINEIILEDRYYMVLSNPVYYYRKRMNESSAIQNQLFDETYYTVTPIKVYKYLFEYSQKIYGSIIPYVQNLVLYDLSWRVTIDKNSLFVTDEYKSIIVDLLNNIDDYIITDHKTLDLAKKVYILGLKYGIDYAKRISYYDTGIMIDGINYNRKNLGFLIIDNIIFRDNNMVLYGKLDTKFIDREKLEIITEKENYTIDYYELTNDYDEITFENEKLHEFVGIKISIDITENFELQFKHKGLTILPRFKKMTYFDEKMPCTYHVYKNRLLYFLGDTLYCTKKGTKEKKLERKIRKYLFKNKKYKSILIRMYMKIAKIFKKKKIMLISDRVDKADDNGEHFFKYMLKEHKNIKSYYIISKKSPDYERMKKYGKVLDNNSFKYKMLFQIADYIVSSQAEDYVFNILGKGTNYVKDQYYFKYIFLQHGIIKDDLSPWLNINTKKMDMFVTSCKDEYQSLLDCKYYFGPEVVKMTGLPRFDMLLKKSKEIEKKKQIMVAVTWRSTLVSKIDKNTGKRLYNDKFKETEYFKNINNLLNDERLLKVLKNKGYIMKFIPHPNLLSQIEDFDKNDYVEFDTKQVDYQKEFCENSLLITDYSSTFFDFAYLNKPVIYYQYDQDEFYDMQVYNKGYFEYEKNGFGPVCKEYDELINQIIKTVENDCKIEEKYLKRIESFYTYHDDKNCDRVYEEIMKL